MIKFSDKYINIFEQWEKMNGEHEIYLYTLTDFLRDLYDTKRDYRYGTDDDDIQIRNDINTNIDIVNNWLRNNFDVLVVDTPCDDDIISFVRFDDDGEIIGHMEIQTCCEPMEYEFLTDDFTCYADIFQLFRVVFNIPWDLWNWETKYTMHDVSQMFIKMDKYIDCNIFNWLYCFVTHDENHDYYETSIYNNLDVFKNYYISFMCDEMDTERNDTIIHLFNTLDVLKNNIYYIHWIDDDNIIIVMKRVFKNNTHYDIAYNYNIWNKTLEKIQNYNRVELITWDIVTL